MRKQTIHLAFLVVTIVLIFGTSYFLAFRPSSPPPNYGLFGVTELPDIDFMAPGSKLILAQPVARYPLTLSYYVVVNGQPYPVKELSDLTGYIHIRTPKSALRYAYLFTWYIESPSVTGRAVLMEGDPELSRQYDVNALRDVYLADKKESPRVRNYGVLLKEDWQANHLTLPTATRVGTVFVVRRYLFRLQQHNETDTIIRVEETITPDGKISRRVLGQQKLSGIIIRIPIIRR